MKIEVDDDGTIVLKEVFNPIKLVSDKNEVLYITMRDSGFEINYEGKKYELKNADIINNDVNDCLRFDRKTSIGLAKIFAGLPRTCYMNAEVYEDSKEDMELAYNKVVKYYSDNNIGR